MENFTKQLGKTFNGTTVRGRANVAKATYGAIALIYLYMRMTRSSKKKVAATSPDCQKNCPACPGDGAGSTGDAADAAAAAGAGAGAAGAAGAAVGSAAGSNGKTGGAAKCPPTAKATDKKSESAKVESAKAAVTDKNNSATAGEEPRKPCKRVEPKQYYDT